MKKIIKQLENEFEIEESTILSNASPVAKYLLLIGFWSLLWSSSLFVCCLFLLWLIIIAVFGRTIPKQSLLVGIVIIFVIVGNIVYTLSAKGNLTIKNILIMSDFGEKGICEIGSKNST